MELSRFLKNVQEFLRTEQVLTDRERMAHFDYDATERHYMPHVVVLPENTEEVSRVMKYAYDCEVPVTPQGGRTGLSGGALPVRGGVVLSLLRMNRIVEIDAKNLIAVVEPGVVSNVFQEELKAYDLFFPPDPSSTVESTLGGNVAENAGYTRAVKYGVTKDYVLGLEAVLPGGEIVRPGGRTVKNVAGYDLTALLTGSEGTLAVITKIIFKLLPRPLVRYTIAVSFVDLIAAADLVVAIFGAGIVPSALEIMDNTAINAVADYLNADMRRDAAALVLIEVDGVSGAAVKEEAELIFRVVTTINGVAEKELITDVVREERVWRARREVLPALKALGKDHLEADVVVPRQGLPRLIDAIQGLKHADPIRIVTFGHAGDGNLHVTILYRKGNFAELEDACRLLAEVYRITVDMGGSLTGEHGVGVTVKDYLPMQKTEADIALMKRVKSAFDPKGLLNPGKIFE